MSDDLMMDLDGDEDGLEQVFAPTPTVQAKPAGTKERLTRIVLEDSDEIPPGGQFFSLMGERPAPGIKERAEALARKLRAEAGLKGAPTESEMVDATFMLEKQGVSTRIPYNRSWLAQPGVEFEAPQELLELLDKAILSVPIVDRNTKQVIGYRDRKRFPYRVVARDV